MYILYMGTPAAEDDFTADVPLSVARATLSDVVRRAREGSVPVFLSSHGRRVAAVIDAEVLERIVELAEDALDLRAVLEVEAEMARTGEQPIPWEQVKADLGLG